MTPMRRAVDIVVALVALLLSAPLVLPVMALIWLQDFRSPFYLPRRIGHGGKKFTMVKLRSMKPDADRNGVDSTVASDPRLTTIGKFVRAAKIDELPQFWNILIGDMTLVGPRPNVERETRGYSEIEKGLFRVKPGITDFSSIVFADLAKILEGARDANIAYNQLVRPWKSRLGLFYIDHATPWVDIAVIALTGIAIISKKTARNGVARMLQRLGAPEDLIAISRRDTQLEPQAPPGFEHIIRRRKSGSPI